MAQTTPNFGFNIAEGTDTVNLLTQCYPNFTSLDSILQGIKETGVTTAVATKTGTNFAVVRTDTDCNFFRFIATANYAAGDTFTVDGVAVTATSPAGSALPAGAFVINQSVIAVLNSSVLTLFVGGGASTVDAEDVDYDNSGSGLTATDVQAAIDEVDGNVDTLDTTCSGNFTGYDFSSSSLPGTTTFSQLIQAMINKLFPAGSYTLSFTVDQYNNASSYVMRDLTLTDNNTGVTVSEATVYRTSKTVSTGSATAIGTMPNAATGGDVALSLPGIWNVTVNMNTLSGITIPTGFSDNYTFTGWTSNGTLSVTIN